ncbi:MAG TPA: chorismate-binding protein, partial [Rhodothermia bacterium]|nr:chorismate-binding protein [Rhodothermia bacterium]
RGVETAVFDVDAAGNPSRRIMTEGGFFGVMQQVLDEYVEVVDPDLPRLRGGAVGYVSYDAVRLLERISMNGHASDGSPDALWGLYRSIVAFDHVKHQVVVISNALVDDDTDLGSAHGQASRNLEQLQEELFAESFSRPERVRLEDSAPSANMTRAEFEQAVRDAKFEIFEGNALQIVLSQRFDTSFQGDRFNLYRALRQVNPSPYLYFLDFGELTLIGSSPEVLVRVEQGRAELLPIAGTRPRGKNAVEDRRLEEDLLEDAKERAEHAMLVDLGRNDLGRVCRLNSVKVDRYAFVERYSHVMHIVSSVSGRLVDGRTPMEVLAACFPAGTVSGAPKVSAMQIIDRLESDRRGVYAGAVGYVDFSGNMDTCIAIRTMVVHQNRVSIQAGAGIVADSDPSREYDETVNKARALHEAIRVAAEELI